MQVGTVAALRRYPVKSMHAEEMQEAELHWTGLAGDRQYAFVRSGNRTHFPWLTGREVPGLVLHRAEYGDPSDLRRSRVRVTAPDGQEWDAFDAALAARLSDAAGEPVHPMRVGRGAYDAMPVSVLTRATAERIGDAHGTPVGDARFRANVLVDALSGTATERDWTGSVLRFGDGPYAPAVRLDCPIPRCAMVAIDPHTAARDPKVVRTVVQRFDNQVGTYCAVAAVGSIAVGAPVYRERDGRNSG